MSAPVPPPDQPVRPTACGNCESADVVPHCHLANCPWSVCNVCNRVSGFVLGQVRHMPSRYPHMHKGGS